MTISINNNSVKANIRKQPTKARLQAQPVNTRLGGRRMAGRTLAFVIHRQPTCKGEKMQMKSTFNEEEVKKNGTDDSIQDYLHYILNGNPISLDRCKLARPKPCHRCLNLESLLCMLLTHKYMSRCKSECNRKEECKQLKLGRSNQPMSSPKWPECNRLSPWF